MVSRKEAITVKLNQVTEDVLKVDDSYGFKQEGAYNLRLNGMAVCHGDSRHIAIVKKSDLPGIDIRISESRRLGFKKIAIPYRAMNNLKANTEGVQIIPIRSVFDLLKLLS